MIIALDINETLLDLSALDEPFREVFGSDSARRAWFTQMLQLSFVGGLTGAYVSFTEAQEAAFLMLASRQGLDLTFADADAMVDRMTRLPSHPEVPAALRRLKQAGTTIVALANSTQQVVEAQLDFAGLRQYFDAVYSADSIRQLKPAPAAYAMVAKNLGASMADIWLVAAHSWDVSGALAAGCSAAFVARSGEVPSPLGPQPAIVATDLDEVVRELLVRTPTTEAPFGHGSPAR